MEIFASLTIKYIISRLPQIREMSDRIFFQANQGNIREYNEKCWENVNPNAGAA